MNNVQIHFLPTTSSLDFIKTIERAQTKHLKTPCFFTSPRLFLASLARQGLAGRGVLAPPAGLASRPAAATASADAPRAGGGDRCGSVLGAQRDALGGEVRWMVVRHGVFETALKVEQKVKLWCFSLFSIYDCHVLSNFKKEKIGPGLLFNHPNVGQAGHGSHEISGP